MDASGGLAPPEPDSRTNTPFDTDAEARPLTERAESVLRASEEWLRKEAEAALEQRVAQQAAVATLSQAALAETSIDVLMDRVVHCVADTLRTEFAKVLELAPGGGELLLRAGVGWTPGLVGRATVGAGRDSQAGFTLLADRPVVVTDLRVETRFTGPALLADHGVVSGMSCAIRGYGWEVLRRTRHAHPLSPGILGRRRQLSPFCRQRPRRRGRAAADRGGTPRC